MIQKKQKPFKQKKSKNNFTKVYNVEILNCFNPELQLKDTEFAIKSKLTNLLNQLRCFKFVITVVLEFKEIESEDKKKV